VKNLQFQDIVWSAVAAVVFGAGSLLAALLGNDSAVLPLGLTSLTAAILSIRERV
jgi:hypothetical protein